MKRGKRALNIIGTATGLVFIWMFCFMFFFILRNAPEGMNISFEEYGTGWLLFGFALICTMVATYTLLEKFVAKHKTVDKKVIPEAIKVNDLICCPKCSEVFEIQPDQKLITCPNCGTKGKR